MSAVLRDDLQTLPAIADNDGAGNELILASIEEVPEPHDDARWKAIIQMLLDAGAE